LGAELEPYERHFNFGAAKHVGLTARQADALQVRYGSAYFYSTYCVQPRVHVYKK
jgi:hypothetical protein